MMKFRKSLAMIALGLSLGPVSVGAQSLADTMVNAYKTSGLLDKNRALLRAADEDVAQAVSALLPVVRYTAGFNQSYNSTSGADNPLANVTSNSTGLNAELIGELLLFDGGTTQAAINAAKETVLATRQALVSIEQQVLLRGVSAHMNVRRAYEFVELRQNNERVIGEEVRATRDRFEVGEVTRTDVSLAEARLAQTRAELAAARGELERAREEYKAVTSVYPGRVTIPGSPPNVERDLQRAKQIALRAHPAVLQQRHLVAAAGHTVNRTQRNMGPKVNLRASVGLSQRLDESRFDDSASIGVNVGQTLYQGGALSSSVRQAISREASVRADLHLVNEEVEQNVGVAMSNYDVARASLAATDEQITAARIAFEGTREEASLGSRTTLDVLDAEQRLLDALASRISAQMDQYIAAYQIMSTMGQLTSRSLGLNVPQYDPHAYYNMVKDAPTNRSKRGQQLDKVLRSLNK